MLYPMHELGELHRGYFPDVLPCDEVVQRFLIQASTMALRTDLWLGELCQPALTTLILSLLILLAHKVGTQSIVREGEPLKVRVAIIIDHDIFLATIDDLFEEILWQGLDGGLYGDFVLRA